MPLELIKEKCGSPISIVEIGLGARAVKVGGETALPFLFEEGDIPNPPIIAYEITDCEPLDWPDALKEAVGDSIKDPVLYARQCVSKCSAKILCVRMMSVHPDWKNASSDEAVKVLTAIAREVDVPLIVVGCGDDEKDNDLLPKVSQALKGQNILMGFAAQNNYKTITATALADGHALIAESPIDINIAKQLNILITDMGFDPKKILMHPTTASLGYGMEYVYSIMERGRLAAFIGDKMLSMPFVLFVGQEVWRTKEAKDAGLQQGINWEIGTAVSMLQAGGDLLVMRHPDAAKSAEKYIEMAMRR